MKPFDASPTPYEYYVEKLTEAASVASTHHVAANSPNALRNAALWWSGYLAGNALPQPGARKLTETQIRKLVIGLNAQAVAIETGSTLRSELRRALKAPGRENEAAAREIETALQAEVAFYEREKGYMPNA